MTGKPVVWALSLVVVEGVAVVSEIYIYKHQLRKTEKKKRKTYGPNDEPSLGPFSAVVVVVVCVVVAV